MREQLRALARAGAEPLLVCYGRGRGPAPPEFEIRRIRRALTPRRLRSGLSPGRPLADLALARELVRAARERRPAAVLAHNIEATYAAFLARRFTGVPVVYVAHTLMGEELGAFAPRLLARRADRFGALLDRRAAAAADAVIALCERARAEIARHARGPVVTIPPGIELHPPPDPVEVTRACADRGLAPGFIAYAGNLDAYQDLGLLAAAARTAPKLPIVVLTHDARGPRPYGLRTVEVRDPQALRSLLHAAAVAVAPRRRAAGFPIKLLNYMEAGLPIVALESAAGDLVHGATAEILPGDADAPRLAAALRDLLRERERAARLGRAARIHAERAHAWPELAARTLALLREVAAHAPASEARV